ncbi:uncharacterized protein LOC142592783 isoform X2 [Dermacentor variabilis]|uniref:uncharacterized protein LOC142592783 isoform X2 n=1 Tax=Dermacentor variabilis TaxID=34621 RepID=UPI003F5B6507
MALKWTLICVDPDVFSAQVSMVPRHLEWMVQWYSHLPVWMHSWLRWRSSCQCSHAAPPSAKALMPLAQCPSVQ